MIETTTLTLANLGEQAQEAFQRELDKVLENVLDPNTDATAKRKVTLTLVIAPTKARDSAAIAVRAESRLAPFEADTRVAGIGRIGGKAVAVPHDVNQMQLDLDAAGEPRIPATGTEG